jgi:hypothetical protein
LHHSPRSTEVVLDSHQRVTIKVKDLSDWNFYQQFWVYPKIKTFPYGSDMSLFFHSKKK